MKEGRKDGGKEGLTEGSNFVSKSVS